MTGTLAERLEEARQALFVGREEERAHFAEALSADELPFQLLYLFGPGGIGKTTLLRDYARLAEAAGVTVVYLDGRHIDPSPAVFLGALQQLLRLNTQTALQEYLAAPQRRVALLVDTYELLSPLEGWLRDEFLPNISSDILVVLAGRQPPAVEWRIDPGWQALVRFQALRNLSVEDSEHYLRIRRVPDGQHQGVLAFTYGHPLALSLVADVIAQKPDTPFQPETAPDAIRALVDRFMRNVAGPSYRTALEACALVRLTTEPLLAAMVEKEEVHDVFNWLADLSFIDATPHGLYPHDLAREALSAHLRWRNPDRYTHLHDRARAYYMGHLAEGDGRTQRRLLLDYIFLHRHNPVVRPYFEWQQSGTVFTDRLREGDATAVQAMVAAHEGSESAAIAAHWLGRQPQNAYVFRTQGGEARGALLEVSLEATTPAERHLDPAVEAAWQYLNRRAPLRAGERATYFRFWLDADDYQTPSPVQSRIFLNVVQHYLTTPSLAYTFFPCAQPEAWQDVFAYADLHLLPDCAFTSGGHTYGVYGHDWRTIPPLAWLTLMGERELAAGTTPQPQPSTETLLVLGEEEFATAVRQALRDFTARGALQNNPLLRSRLVVEEAGADSDVDSRVATLQRLLDTAVAALDASPRQKKWHRALQHTYLQPAATQEQAAELLDLPFSTYRRHLTAGLTDVVNQLWQREVGVAG